MGFLDEVLIDGAKLDADISGRINTATSIRTMDGASSIELAIIDADRKLRESGILTRRGHAPKSSDFDRAAWGRFGLMRLTYRGRFFRLAGVTKPPGSDVLTLTFEDEIASIMRRFKGPYKASRADMSRLEFVWTLAKRARAYPIVVNAPEMDVKQPIKGDTARARAKAREKGIPKWKHLEIQGVNADAEQRRNIETIMGVADELQAGDLATTAMLCAAIGESRIRAVMNFGGSGYGGVFQGDVTAHYHYFKVTDTEQQAHYFLKGGKGYQAGGAIKLASDNPDMDPGEIATKVEASGEDPGFYGQWAGEAKAIIEAWGGVGKQTVVERHRYEYRVYGERDGQPAETYWDAAGRLLVDEVRFRRFACDNILNLVSDDWLFGRMPVFELEESPDVLIGYEADIGMPVATVNVTARKPLWTGRPGNVAEITKREGPIAGGWLIQSLQEDMFEIDPCQMVLRRPAPHLKEPAADKDTIVLTESPAEAGSVRRAVVDAAKAAVRNHAAYTYAMTRPMPSSLAVSVPGPGGGHVGQVRTDCSGFVTLAYKAGGAPDPNGRGYDGFGSTLTLWANGSKTNDPQPGDLVFYGSTTVAGASAHVGVYIGGGRVIEFGGQGGPRNLPVDYRSDRAGYRTYGI